MFDRIKEKRMKNKIKRRRNKKVLLIVSGIFTFVLLLTLISGIASEENNSNSSTYAHTASASESVYTSNSDVAKSNDATLKPVKLETIESEIELETGEKYDYASFYNYEADIDLKSSEIAARSDNETVAGVEIKEIDADEVYLIISGVSKGEANISLTSKDGSIKSDNIHVVIVDSENENGSEPIELLSDEDEIKIRVKEKNTDVSLYTDERFVNLSDYNFEAYSDDADVAKVKIENITSQSISLLITGVGVGETYISVMSDDGKIVSDDIHITVKKTAKSEHSKTTTERKITTTEMSTTDVEERTVYITPSGSCYHMEYCRYVKGNGSEITIRHAKASGYRACKVCCP